MEEEEGGAGGEEGVKEAIPNHREALTAGTSNIICSPVVKHKSALLPVFITASLWWFVRHLMLFSGGARPASASRDPVAAGMLSKPAEKFNVCKKAERENLRSR